MYVESVNPAHDPAAVSHARYQYEAYLQGAAGILPALPFDWRAIQSEGERAMTAGAVGYVSGGAGAESTMRANRAAFDRWRIVPRVLREVPAARDLSTAVLGTRSSAPVMLAPVGVLSIVHEAAELAVARAARALSVPMIVSSAASTPMERVADVLDGAPAWFQLYWPSDTEVAASFVQRAEQAGFAGIVVTLDTWQLGWRPRDLATAYLPFLRAEGLANYFSDPAFRAGLRVPPERDRDAAVVHFLSMFTHPALTWSDLAWLRERTTLPIVLKGIQHPDDARRAADAGVDGVVCSNHGGRQVDGAIASLDALQAVVAASAGLPVLFDSGVRSGADAVKALALGASSILLGRPWVYGLALAGQAGVEHALRVFLADLDLQLGLAGYRSVAELSPEALVARGAG